MARRKKNPIPQEARLVNRGANFITFMRDELDALFFGYSPEIAEFARIGRRKATTPERRRKLRAAGKRQRQARRIQQRKARA